MATIITAAVLGLHGRLGAPPRRAQPARRSLLVAVKRDPKGSIDLGPGKTSPAFQDMKNPQESYLSDSEHEDDKAPAPVSESDDPSKAPESGTVRPDREHSAEYRQSVASGQVQDQEGNEFAAPESGDVRDDTSGRGNL